MEFEERIDSPDRIFAILARVIHIPLHQYARYFERFRGMAAQRPVAQVVPEDVLAGFQQELGGDEKQTAPAEVERELRARVDAYLLSLFNSTQAETSQRWTYEQEIKRPYYHVTELDDDQLDNWRRYLDFEEGKGDYARTKFLYERCLVTCANYEEFWFRYIRWTLAQMSIAKEVRNEEVRIIYSRASCIFVSIAQPSIRLNYARFEESIGRADTAIAIHEAILATAPGDLETVLSLVNTHRRQYGVDAAIKVLKTQLNTGENGRSDRGALVAELARLHWKVKGDADEARQTFQKQQEHCDNSPEFWIAYFDFELNQPTSLKEEASRHQHIKALFDHIRSTSKLIKNHTDTFFELSRRYLDHLLDRGDKDAMQEYVRLDRELNGPSSVRILRIDVPKVPIANGS